MKIEDEAEIRGIRLPSKIGIYSKKEAHYLMTNLHNMKVSCKGQHPMVYIKGMNMDATTEFNIVDYNNKQSNNYLHFRQPVMLSMMDQEYLTFETGGGIKFEKNEIFEKLSKKAENAPLAQLAKWTLIDVENSENKGIVTSEHTVVMTSAYQELLTVFPEHSSIKCAKSNIKNECSQFRIVKNNIPMMSEWLVKRKYMVAGKIKEETNERLRNRRKSLMDLPKTLGSVNFKEQERYILGDLLLALQGISGNYIKQIPVEHNNTSGREWKLEGDLGRVTCDDTLHASVVNHMLPMCEHYMKIKHFVDEIWHTEYGQIWHAVAGGVQILLKEYHVYLAQLHTIHTGGKLTIQKLLHYMLSSISTFHSLDQAIYKIRKSKGGQILNQLYELTQFSSNPNAKKVFSFLLEKGLTTYSTMLGSWLYQGLLVDPFQEFMILENTKHGPQSIENDFNDSYWNLRFTYRHTMIPRFLEKLKDKIRVTGKYLNVIRECGGGIKSPLDQGEFKLMMSTCHFLEDPNEERAYIALIDKVHEWSSARLIQMLFKEFSLLDHLKSMKRYFFMQSGDLFINFIESSEDFLGQNVTNISFQKLESHFDMALRLSSANVDPFKENVFSEMNAYSLREQYYAFLNIKDAIGFDAIVHSEKPKSPEHLSTNLTQCQRGYEAFCLDYKAEWPLNLILSGRAKTKYQLLFRCLFLCRYIEIKLGGCWQGQKLGKELDIQDLFQQPYLLLNKMQHFVKNLMHYMISEVIEPKWHKFMLKLQKLQSLDDILTLHNKFLDSCLKECFLTNSELNELVINALQSCSFYVHLQTKNFKDHLFTQENLNFAYDFTDVVESELFQMRDTRNQEVCHLLRQSSHLQNVKKIYQKFALNFNDCMRKLLNYIERKGEQETYLTNLAMLLDYNLFYDKSIEQFEV